MPITMNNDAAVDVPSPAVPKNTLFFENGTLKSKDSSGNVVIYGSSGSVGTVTSIDASGANGILVSGGPITTAGTLDFSLGDISPTSLTTGNITTTGALFANGTTGIAGQILTSDASGKPSWQTPSTGYKISSTNNTDVDLGTGTAPTPWVQLDPTITPTQTIPAGSGSYHFENLIQNNTTRTGVIDFGIGINGNPPDPDKIYAFSIGANYQSVIAYSVINQTDIIAGNTYTLYGRIESNNGTAFHIISLNSIRQSIFQISQQGQTGGTVVGFTFTDANGIHGIVDTPTTTPNLTLSLNDITPTSVTSTGPIEVNIPGGDLPFIIGTTNVGESGQPYNCYISAEGIQGFEVDCNSMLVLGDDPGGQIFTIQHKQSGNFARFVNQLDGLQLTTGSVSTNAVRNLGNPQNNTDATNKQYVDQLTSTLVPEAPTDGQTYGRNNAAWTPIVPGGVTSFNTRTGAVVLSSADVNTALGYTPYNGATNPNNYLTASTGVSQIVAGTGITITPTGGVGAVTINSSGGGGGIPDAPSDGNYYVRQNGAWTSTFNGGTY